jgi:DNA-binding transcriptional LysR family regulator
VDTLESMRAFVRVVELGGFAAAARSLDLSPDRARRPTASASARGRSLPGR